MYDYLLVGAGLTSAVIARELTDRGKKCLVIEKRNHIAGGCYDYEYNGFPVCKYGGHIFHTNSKTIWDYINKYSEFNQYNHRIVAAYNSNIYSFPINLMTFYQLGFPYTPKEAKEYIDRIRIKYDEPPANFEEKTLSLVGEEIYSKFFYGYSKKQWNREPSELPASLIERIPIRFTFDNAYFADRYQGMPTNGYTKLIENLFDGVPIELNIDYLEEKNELSKLAQKVIYTGEIDRYYNYCFGKLEYRSLKFEIDTDLDIGSATINYTDYETPCTRQISFNHFYPNTKYPITITEYPSDSGEPYYPVPTKNNKELYTKYASLENGNTIFCGRLGRYTYLNMDQTVGQGLEIAKKL